VPAGSRVGQRIRLHRIAARYQESWARMIASERVLRELDGVAEQGAFSAGSVASARGSYGEWREAARSRLNQVAGQFPEYVGKAQELVALRLCLQEEAAAIQDMSEVDALSERDVERLRWEIEERLRALRREPIQALRPEPRELLAKVPFFRGLPEDEFARIVALLRPRTVLAGEEIVRQGDPGEALFLIGRGVVHVRVRAEARGEAALINTLIAGDFFGEMAVLDNAPRAATVAAGTDAVVYELRRRDLEAVLAVCPTMRQVLETASAERRLQLAAAAAGLSGPRR
jgi:monovalent cation:H+ antiporter, CPA1 family